MGERGNTLHVLDGKVGEDLGSLGYRVAVLGSSERWTTFVPTDASVFDSGHASEILDRPLAHLWFDDNAGVSVQAYAAGNFVGELSLPSDDAEVTESDLAFTETLEELGMLSPVQRAALLERMSDPAGLREWTMKHGLEKLLALPFYDPIPTDLPEREILELLPKGVRVLDARKASKAKSAKAKAKAITPKTTGGSKPMVSPKESWSDEERATLELHFEYWSTVFSMNNRALYNRYKKHLPAEQRRDVDELCNAVAVGDDDEVPRLVKGVLARIWACENWDAVIRDPALVDGDEHVWQEWLARLSC
jgi:hypothetical protein